MADLIGQCEYIELCVQLSVDEILSCGDLMLALDLLQLGTFKTQIFLNHITRINSSLITMLPFSWSIPSYRCSRIIFIRFSYIYKIKGVKEGERARAQLAHRDNQTSSTR